MPNFLRSGGLAVAGFCYGLLLLVLGVMAGGGGHGTYVVAGVSSSPLGVTQSIPLTILGAPILWCLEGAMLGRAMHRGPRKLFLGTMLAHYVALPFILSPVSNFGDWAYARKVPGRVALGLAAYGAGQLVIWILFVAGVRKSREKGSREKKGNADMFWLTAAGPGRGPSEVRPEARNSSGARGSVALPGARPGPRPLCLLLLISSPWAGSNLIRHTSPLRRFVVIDFFLTECVKAGKVLVVAIVLFCQRRRCRQDPPAALRAASSPTLRSVRRPAAPGATSGRPSFR